jgi:choline dehydrogenase-like flavoprotein
MRSCDVLIVGGGPAGSAAAWKLTRGGADVLVLDRERFPRLKLCAGWITPEVVPYLQMDIASYPHRFLTFDRLHVPLKGLHLRARRSCSTMSTIFARSRAATYTGSHWHPSASRRGSRWELCFSPASLPIYSGCYVVAFKILEALQVIDVAGR